MMGPPHYRVLHDRHVRGTPLMNDLLHAYSGNLRAHHEARLCASTWMGATATPTCHCKMRPSNGAT